MLAKVFSSAVHGIEGYIVEVEVDIANGLPQFDIVGLPDASVREARERVRSAIRNSGFEFPLKRITVNLAPANRKKHGSGLDLPISIGILAASDQIPASAAKGIVSAGELALDGGLRPIPGILPISLSVRNWKHLYYKRLLIPSANAPEASVVNDIEVYPVDNLWEAVSFIKGALTIPKCTYEPSPEPQMKELDFSEVCGQEAVKRALAVAAAGAHNILMIGPPGAGKTMLAKRLTTILPNLTEDESLEVSKIYSVTGLIPPGKGLLIKRPWRCPHHGISLPAMIGGGRNAKPGEITLSHHGVLFLDEMSQFRREVLESLRSPLEDGFVVVSRSSGRFQYPSRFMLVGSTNPCACGYMGDHNGRCSCTSAEVNKYIKKISGPLMDRFDIIVNVRRVSPTSMIGEVGGISSNHMRDKVVMARKRQNQRLKPYGFSYNAQMPPRLIKQFCRLNVECKTLLEKAFTTLKLSSRSYHRILKVALSIADLEESDRISISHVAEAIQYRSR